ncbi:MAG: SagB/ThcOx family dehydrogenase [Myxococcota bacterium]
MANTDRRGFFRFSAGVLAALGVRPAHAEETETALAIHRATRNTELGAIGARIRRWRGPLQAWKPYPGKPRVALPVPEATGGRGLEALVAAFTPDAGFAPTTVSLGAVSQLLFLANGVTQPGPAPLRAAPSAGALYAGELYLVAERVRGLEAGVYSYAPLSGELVRLRSGKFLGEVAGAVEVPGDRSEAALAVAITNVFARYQVRYANRGYRYALIDAGHIGENLRLAAAELGLHETGPLRFEDDHLNALLGIDGRKEAVCDLHFVGAPGAGGSARPAPRPLVEHQWSTERPEGGASGATAPERYHTATKLVPRGGASGGAAPASGASATRPANARRGPRAPLTLRAAIRARRSASAFDAAPVPREKLVRLLSIAQDNPSLQRCIGLDLYVVAHRVEHTPPGLYRYAPGTQALEPHRREALSEPLVEATLGQERSGQAGLAVVGVARLGEAVAREGERSYRHLLLEAGATAQRVYLAAEALGLAARNLAAFYDDALDALLGLDGTREVAVHLTAVGLGR